MKLQGLAVIFVLIILPISIVLSEYIQVQIDTLNVQTAYDSQLLSATYDAVIAFQKNTVNSWSSTITSSKIRDIEASANVFLTSIADSFKMSGNSKEALKEYVPAIVYTLYDGYYIYTPFINQIDYVDNENYNDEAYYKNGERTFGLKPYIYYSREYENYPKYGDSFVITYSLDNYITIQGTVNGNFVNEGGYIIDITGLDDNYDGSTYKGADIITNDVYEENVGNGEYLKCVKVNGTKYYLDYDENALGRIFYFIQSDRNYLSNESAETIKKYFDNNNSAREYYLNAYKFTKKLLGNGPEDFNLSGLKSSDAKDWNKYTDKNKRTNDEEGIKDTQADYIIFDNSKIEYYNSDFNQERRAVIKYAIEKNLSTSIANFNNISENTETNFQMPKLSDDEWDRAINNISIITFLQGINMGNRPYNGYAIVPNNKNEESVGEDSIYIVANGEYHRVNDKDLLTMDTDKIEIGVFNMNFEKKAIDLFAENDDRTIVGKEYFYPRGEMACYNSIVSQTGTEPLIDNNGLPITIYEYLDSIKTTNQGKKIASVYYTALGRERNGLVKYGLKKYIEEYTEHSQGQEGNNSGSGTNNEPGTNGGAEIPDNWGTGNEEGGNNDNNTDLGYMDLKVGNRVIYTSNNGTEIPCIVLYDSENENFENYGVQIITEDILGNVTLGGETFVSARNSYNDAITALNDYVLQSLNANITDSCRCIGTNPTDGSAGINSADNLDYKQMNKKGYLRTTTSSSYWMGSKKLQNSSSTVLQTDTYYIDYIKQSEELPKFEEFTVAYRFKSSMYNQSYGYRTTHGVRGVFKLKENIKVVEENGNKYIRTNE